MIQILYLNQNSTFKVLLQLIGIIQQRINMSAKYDYQGPRLRSSTTMARKSMMPTKISGGFQGGQPTLTKRLTMNAKHFSGEQDVLHNQMISPGVGGSLSPHEMSAYGPSEFKRRPQDMIETGLDSHKISQNVSVEHVQEPSDAQYSVRENYDRNSSHHLNRKKNNFINVQEKTQVQDPQVLCGILLKSVQKGKRVDFRSLRELTLILSKKTENFANLGKVPRLDYVEHGMKQRNKTIQASLCDEHGHRDEIEYIKKLESQQTTRWDGEGGYEGFAQWIVNDFVGRKQWTVAALATWIDELEPHQIGREIDLYFAAEDRFEENVENMKGVCADSHVGSGHGGGSVHSQGHQHKKDGAGHTHAPKPLNQRSKGIPHHVLDSVVNQLSGFPRNEDFYRRCTSANLLMKQAEPSRGSAEYDARFHGAGNVPKGQSFLVTDCNKLINRLCEQSHPTLKTRPLLCVAEKMASVVGPEEALPMPAPFGDENMQVGSHDKVNAEFAINPQFVQRNMAAGPEMHVIHDYHGREPQGIRRCIVSEYAIEDWYAQSLGMSTEDYLNIKKKYERAYKAERRERENLYPTEDFPDKPRKPVAIKEAEEEDTESLSQISALKSGAGGPRARRGEGGSKSAAELAAAKAHMAGQQLEPPVQRSLIEFIAAMGRDKRGGPKRIESRQDLQPRLCNKYDKEKSFVVAMFGGYGRRHIPKEDLNELKAQVSHLEGGVIARAGGGAPSKAARPATAATPGLRRANTQGTLKRRGSKVEKDATVENGSEDSNRADQRTAAKPGYTTKLLPAHQRVLMNEFGGFKDKLIQKCYEQTLKISRRKAAEASKKREDRSVEEQLAGGKAEAAAVKKTQKGMIKQLLRENKEKNEQIKLKRREAFLKRLEADRQAKADAAKRSRNGHVGLPRASISMEGVVLRGNLQVPIRRPKPYYMKTTAPGIAHPAPTRSQIEARAHEFTIKPQQTVPIAAQKPALSAKSAAVLHEANHFDPYLKLVGLQEANAIQKAKSKLLAAQYRRAPQQAAILPKKSAMKSEAVEANNYTAYDSEDQIPTYGFVDTRTIQLPMGDMPSRNALGNHTVQNTTALGETQLSLAQMPKRPSEVVLKAQLRSSGFKRGRSGDRAATSSTGFTASATGGVQHPYDWPRGNSESKSKDTWHRGGQRPQSEVTRPRGIREQRPSGAPKRQGDLLLCASYQLDGDPAARSLGRRESRETIDVDEVLSSAETAAKIPPNWKAALAQSQNFMKQAGRPEEDPGQRAFRAALSSAKLRRTGGSYGEFMGTFDRGQILGLSKIDERDFDDLAIDAEMRRLSTSSAAAASKTPRKLKNKNIFAPGDEGLFYTMNRTVKGISVTRESQVRLRQTTQDMCFENQKRAMVIAAAQRTITKPTGPRRASRVKGNMVQESVMTSKMQEAGGALGTLGTTIQPTTLVVLKHDREQMRAQIQAEVKRDNDFDIKNPFVAYEGDRRAFKIGLKTKDIRPAESLRNQKFKFDEEQFWYLKGYDHVHCNSPELDSAIDSYSQALRLMKGVSPDVMHNLACVYESQQRFELAIKWFDMVIQTDPDNEALLDSYYGAALCYLKNGEPRQAIEKLTEAIVILADQDIKVRKMMHKFYFRYLRAICYRVSGEYKSAEKDYVAVKRHFDTQEGTQYCHRIFAMIIMPNERDRRQLQKFVEQFVDVIDQYEVDRDRRLLSQAYIEGQDRPSRPNLDPKWDDRKVLPVCSLLSRTSFFKRFSFPRIRELMDKMTLRVFEKDSILFFEPDKVYVIVSGSVQMKCHQKRTDLPQTYAKFQGGSIMNFLRDGVDIFNSIETWFLAQVQSEVAIFDKAYFERVWNEDIMTKELMLKRQILRCYPIFQQLSDLAIMSLVSELIEFKTFKKGELIVPQSLSAPTSEGFQELLESHQKLHETKETLKKQQQQLGVRAPQLCLHKREHAEELKKQEEEAKMKQGVSNVFSFVRSSKLRTPAQGSGGSDVHNSTIASGADGHHEHNRTSSHGHEHDQSHGHVHDHKGEVTIEPKLHVDLTKQQQSTQSMFSENPHNKSESLPTQPLTTYRGAQARAGGHQPGVYLVTRGVATVVNPADGYRACQLRGGEIFGEADQLKIVGYEFFGDIIAESDECQCMFISTRHLREIPEFEKLTMKEFAEARLSIRQLAYRYSERYKKPYADFVHYYSTVDTSSQRRN